MRRHLLAAVLLLACPALLHAQSPATGLTPADFEPEPMEALAQPGYLETVDDPAFGTTIRRITNAAPGSRGVVPMYSTVQAWNADESLMIVYELGVGHQLLDGQTYELIRMLGIAPLDVEQVFWDHDDPDVFYYPTYVDARNTTLYMAHEARTGDETEVADLGAVAQGCGGGAVRFGGDVQMPSRNDDVIGFRCTVSGESYLYSISSGTLTTVDVLDDALQDVAATPTPSGAYAFHLSETYDGSDGSLTSELAKADKSEHSCTGTWSDGSDAVFSVGFDADEEGDCISQLVGYDVVTGECYSLLPRDAGWPYPRTATHMSALAHNAAPGWVAVSMIGNSDGSGLLDQELLLVKASKVASEVEIYRVGHHRSDEAQVDYWGEPHVTISPSGTRLLFGSDWNATGSTATLQSYVVELPTFAGSEPLPAEVISLSAKPTPDQRIEVSWETASETNVDRFAVELAGDAEASFAEAANTLATGPGAYVVQTPPLDPGTYYLQLRTIDTDGTSTVSDVLSVQLEAEGSGLRVVSAPGEAILRLALTSGQSLGMPLRVFDPSGRLVWESRDVLAPVDASSWSAGVYTATVGTWRGRWVR